MRKGRVLAGRLHMRIGQKQEDGWEAENVLGVGTAPLFVWVAFDAV